MFHEMRLNTRPFEAIACGTKDIEIRLYDEKRRLLQVGDRIRFRERGGDRTLQASIVALHVFSDFKALYDAFPPARLGYACGEDVSPTDMEAYYSQEAQHAFGVVAIELKLLPQ